MGVLKRVWNDRLGSNVEVLLGGHSAWNFDCVRSSLVDFKRYMGGLLDIQISLMGI